MDNPKVLRGPSQAGYLDRVVQQAFQMQCHHRRKSILMVSREVNRATGLNYLAHALPALHRLDYAQHNSRSTQRNPMPACGPFGTSLKT